MKRLHSLTMNNLELLKLSSETGCFYCLETFTAEQALDAGERCDSGNTVMCPGCSTDALVPTTDAALLDAMHSEYFSIAPVCEA